MGNHNSVSSAVDMENNFGLSNSSYHLYGADRVNTQIPETLNESTGIQDLFATTAVSMVTGKSAYVMPTQSRNFREGMIPQGIMPGYNMPMKARKARFAPAKTRVPALKAQMKDT